ncbi:TonB-dependent siderophore receptor [Pusillimonas harenae]|uniref:TonB-dependent siderophore receptor n=2 Tax=Pollutimonas harenae TaxID=657015 RepID=A0A853GYP5_9BURK|nr:TonB-dependent siderophore receptor [Pollutimonas harenae]TEA73609.1 TonB-dependent siderophore receptor [Pollutimonas harenae]
MSIASAQTQSSAQQGDTRTLAPITVTAQPALESPFAPVDGYIARRSISATKTNTPLSETPQSVTVVTSEEIRDQGATGLQDALNYAAGVRSNAYGLDSRSDNFRIRGSEPSVFLDGLRTNYNWYTSTTRAEPYTLERIEVLRGPSSMLYGQGSTAGVVNMVTKRPLAEPMREIGISYGSYNRRQIQADFTGPIDENGEWLYRVVALGRLSDTQVDYVPDDRWVLAPSLTWQPSASTSLTLRALLQEDKSGSTAQFFPWEGVALPNPNGQIPTDTFIGDPDWDRYNSSRRAIGWSFEHAFNDNWTVRQNTRWSHNEVDYRSLYANAFSGADGWPADPINKRLLSRYADGTITTVKMASADQHLEGTFDTGSIEHQMLVGFDVTYSKEDKVAAFESYDTVPLIDAFNPIYPAYTPPAFNDHKPTVRQRDMGVYLQDQLRYGNWIAVAGLRRDRSKNIVEGGEDQVSQATSKRLGVMYTADNGFSPYLSYSESFTPVLGRDASGTSFVPIRGKQLEAGVKYESADGDLVVNAAAYTLHEENRLVADPNDPTEQAQIGKTRNRGIELELKTAIGRQFDLIANYSYIDLDDQLEGLPKHQASLWGKYRFAIGNVTGLSVGAGVRWLGGFQDGAAPRTPSVTLVDTMLAYETPSWRYALNINNLSDETYVSTCLGRGDCWYGSRRSIVASATYRF